MWSGLLKFAGLHCTDEGQQPETSIWMSAVCQDRSERERGRGKVGSGRKLKDEGKERKAEIPPSLKS